MPQINSIPEVLYQPNQPYHYIYDNLPLRNILTRIGLVNSQVDTTADLIRGLAGTAGTPAARLGNSLNQDGSLKAASVDDSMHNIGMHEDGLGEDGVSYVRMTEEERAKLDQIQSEANRLLVEVEDQYPTMGNYVTMTDGVLRLRGSSSIFFDFEAPDTVRAHSMFPPQAAHRHNYGLEPVHQNLSSPDRINYRTTSYSTPYAAESLRVYVNGVRLFRTGVPVPNVSGTSFTSTYVSSESSAGGVFSLNRALSSNDVIRIDFDEAFVPPSSSSSSSKSSSSSS